jgi:N-acetylneuraminic acid mutarotase
MDQTSKSANPSLSAVRHRSAAVAPCLIAPKRKNGVVVRLVLLLLPASLAAQTPGPAVQGTWTPAPSMHTTRNAHNVVSTDRAIYVLAGSGAGFRPVLEVERFDGQAWSLETTLPGNGLNAPASAILNNRIYVVSGFNGVSNTPTAEVRYYDLMTRTWHDAAPLPAPRGGHGIAVLNGKIHVFGGGNSVSTIADHSEFDPATNRWGDRAPLKRAKGSPAGVVMNGRIYAIGGRSGPQDFGDVEIYDPATNRWADGPSIEPRGTAGAVLYRGAIFLFGGESQAKKASLNSVLRFNPQGGTWEETTPMPTARNYSRAVLFRDAVFVVGGNTTAGASHSAQGSAVVERFSIRP